MGKAIYNCILEAITEDGTLSKEFVLPENGESDLKFVSGAKDGVLFYHGGFYSENEETSRTMILDAINMASNGDEKEAMKIAEEYAKTGRTLEFIDETQKYIIDHKDNLNAGKIRQFAVDLMMTGTHVEAVKLGMSLLELFNINQEDKLKELVRTLALCDEFTLFSAFIMAEWDNANIELWNAAKHVRGWGRVHLMRIIDPQDNEEIEQWMLKEGIKNEVLASYSGLDIFQKTHYLSRLKDDLSLEMYRGMANVMVAILDEGPVQGVSTIDDVNELFKAFIKITKKRDDLEANDYWACGQILDYMKSNNEPEEKFRGMIDDLQDFLTNGKVREIIYSALANGDALQIAQELGYDYKEYTYQACLKEPRKNAYLGSELIGAGYKSEELVDFYYDRLGIEKIGTGPEKNLGLGKEYEIHGAVDYILQNLREQVGLGEKIVKVAIVSPVTRNRNGALRVIESWMKKTKKPLNAISQEMFETVQAAEPNEVVVSVKEWMGRILSNQVDEKEQ